MTVNFNTNMSGLQSGINQARNVFSSFTNAIPGGLGVVAGAVAAVGTVAIGVGVAATKMAADYEQSMNKVQALTGASTAQIAQFDSSLKQLAMQTGVAPKALSEGLYNVVSAGYQGADAINVLSLATRDSVIGMKTNASVTT